MSKKQNHSLEEKLDNTKQCLYWKKDEQKTESKTGYAFFNNPCVRCTGYENECKLYFSVDRKTR